ncbi:MAG: SDR family NAD(P)-dependent oxidoreductase [Rhizobiales bacterium]|nr:SDR family NAD(P)-dependent oxidoreductase [Hyphomicrobiales bacterium]
MGRSWGIPKRRERVQGGGVSSLHFLRDEIAVIGWSCRVPGANSVEELWSLLLEGRCSISAVPPDRWSLAQYGHPRRKERGKSYTWAAGIIDDVWGFDPSLFGISPREAEQMDPQQRILLELTWEALEDAGIRPTSISGSEVGVFVGGSSTDYANARWGDPAGLDSHFATGNALSILANRISYVFDLHGPSLTVDTACSSSLVALHQAAEALRAGRIDTAIVGGINVLASPFSFISFSQASMLSPTGLCRAFSAKADGYVRAEGGGVLVLRKATQARVDRNPIHGVILASDVNSDGRTNGISLPSGDAQEHLLERIYPRAEIDPKRLAFIEAHGTGTAVGDPTEANAVGRVLGRARAEPLPIGSIKTNIGHLEPASGLAGMMKALLALNHGMLPRSLHFDDPNPSIDFDRLNLSVCAQPLPLPNAAQQCAGVNSFGFGGTNAHVVVAPGRPSPAISEEGQVNGAGFFSVSAETHPALVGLAQKYAERLSTASDKEASIVARAAAHRRDRLSMRLVVSASKRSEVVDALDAFIIGEDDPRLIAGTALGNELPVAFVFSGNGSQWVGMGIAAYRDNEEFRAHFDQTDEILRSLAGWSLREALYSETLSENLKLTCVAQPLIFAIQSAAAAALRRRGLQPAVVLGHSVGEVAAAEAAGILDRQSAVKVIHSRSTHQELVRGAGRMAAVLSTREAVDQILKSVRNLSIAAINSPRAVTLAGPTEAIGALREATKRQRLVFRDLDLDYPFHTPAMAPVEAPLLSDLKDLVPLVGSVPFVSTVTGTELPGLRLNAAYWWQNVREPVLFEAALKQAVKLGARLFVEIGPRSTLLTHISDSVDSEGDNFAVLSVLDRSDKNEDPFSKAVATCIVRGARVDDAVVFGPDPGAVPLPTYPWQHREFRNTLTPEATGHLFDRERHPLCGARISSDALEWRGHLDTTTMPALADHKIGEQVILPGAAFLEMALAVTRHWLHTPNVSITDFEILKPLDLTGGETREILCRVSPGSNTLEILSRPRLTGAAWLLHARGKMFHANHQNAVLMPVPSGAQATVHGEGIYRLARMSGLNYGPAFRLVDGATRPGPTTIEVTLTPVVPSESESVFHLDPMRLDACFHGLFVLFPDLQAESRGVAYIPVRFDEMVYYATGGLAQRAIISLRNCNERSVVADFYIYGADGEVIAILRGAHFQAVLTRRTPGLESIALVEQLQMLDGHALRRSGIGVSAEKVIARAQTVKVDHTASLAQADESFILEGWAMAMAYEIAAGLSGGEEFSPDMLVNSGNLPPEMLPWFRNILFSLEGAGLAKEGHGRWTLLNDPLLPSSTSVLRALATEHPSRAAELLLAGELSGLAATLAAELQMSAPVVLSNEALDYYAIAGTWAAKASEWLTQLLQKTEAMWPADRSLRLLQIGFGPLSQSLLSMIQSRNIHLTVLEPDRRRFERAKLALPNSSRVKLLDLQNNSQLGQFDLIIGAESLHRLPTSLRLAKLQQALAPRGMLICIEPQPSLFRDLVFGLLRGWFDRSVGGFPIGSLLTAGEWKQALESAGFANAHAASVSLGSESALLIVSESPAQAAKHPDRSGRVEADGVTTLIVAGTSLPQREIATTLAALLPRGGAHVAMVMDETGKAKFPDLASDVVVQFLPMADDVEAEPNERLSSRCMEIKGCAERIGSARATLWIVFSGALSSGSAKVHPVETGAWAFSRTLANEFPNLDIRRVDVAPQVSKQVAAERIRDLVLSDTDETEILIDTTGIQAARVESIKQNMEGAPEDFAPAAQLQRRMMSNQRLHWRAIDRSLPLADEIEIAVEATGLNFRDLMWMLSLLPEDMLEHGFTGPTLGLECAGRIIQIGANVRHFKVGDHVVALAPSAFSTHVVIPAVMAAKVPEGLSSEDAATIPVAFLTAFYSLLRLAKVRRGEWVLIHGGAGAVGMAAIQIAHWRGAQVIATAGSKAKRDLLKALGVAHVLDSRSTDFVDEVKRITKAGVDVVLNSLAGEAMERGMSTLRPFGRFVELGKRDYVSNTHIGLRPFRRNLTYFGVDLDNLIEAKKGLGHRIYRDVMRLFRDGVLTPLPHSVFPATEVLDAFHLMQQSGHIGKIVVQPPRPGTIRKPNAPFSVDGHGTHLITGAFGGFGLETAKWLVDHGARHLVLLGRRGPVTDEAKTVLSDFAKRGVKVLVETCDVGDRRAVEKLFEKMHTRMPPVAGVIHAAMVLEDALIANLDADQLNRVLRPKVKGAENLDIATRGLSLDYFVLFSSVTTLIGNPGQGSYVAANGFMEGLARRRRQEGLPALAIGWGPISNVGVVALNKKLQKSLQVRSGVRGLVAREALDLMAEALEQTGSAPNLAVVTIASNEWTLAGDRLRVLRSPTYTAVVRDDGAHGDSAVTTLDLRSLLATEDLEIVRRRVADRIVSELARVLHSREEDISRVRPMSEIGVDSLMALELNMNLKDAFGVEIPLSNSAGSMTVAGLAEEMIAQVNLDASRDEDSVAHTVAEQHIAGKIETEHLEALKYAQQSESQKTKRLLS